METDTTEFRTTHAQPRPGDLVLEGRLPAFQPKPHVSLRFEQIDACMDRVPAEHGVAFAEMVVQWTYQMPHFSGFAAKAASPMADLGENLSSIATSCALP